MRRLLLNPTPGAVAQCAGHLGEAAAALGALQQDLPGARSPHLQGELSDLRRELGHAEKLLEGAAARHIGWARIVASSAGYTQSGALRELPAHGRLSVQG